VRPAETRLRGTVLYHEQDGSVRGRSLIRFVVTQVAPVPRITRVAGLGVVLVGMPRRA
jgi:hypothetical protein